MEFININDIETDPSGYLTYHLHPSDYVGYRGSLVFVPKTIFLPPKVILEKLFMVLKVGDQGGRFEIFTEAQPQPPTDPLWREFAEGSALRILGCAPLAVGEQLCLVLRNISGELYRISFKIAGEVMTKGQALAALHLEDHQNEYPTYVNAESQGSPDVQIPSWPVRISFDDIEVEGGQLANVRLNPSSHLDYGIGTTFVPRAVLLDSSASEKFKIEKVFVGDEGKDDSCGPPLRGTEAIKLCREITGRAPSIFHGSVSGIFGVVVCKDEFIRLSIRNTSNEKAVFSGTILGDVVLPGVNPRAPSSSDVPTSLYDRCVRWFNDGVALGVKEVQQRISGYGNTRMNREDDEILGETLYPEDQEKPMGIRDRFCQLIVNSIAVADLSQTTILRLVDLALDRVEGKETSTGQALLAFGPQVVKPGETVYVTAKSMVPFRPKALKITPPGLALSIDILDIRVGKNSQFIAVGSLPGTAFALDNGTLVEFKMDAASPGLDIAINVRSLSTKEITFSAVMVGDIVSVSSR